MSNDLDDLKDLFDEALPPPDPEKRAAAIALAKKNFADAQETAQAARPTPERQRKGAFKGVWTMLFDLNRRAVLTATTALAAVALVAFIPVMNQAPSVSPSAGGGILDLSTGSAPRAPVRTVTPAPSPATEADSIDAELADAETVAVRPTLEALEAAPTPSRSPAPGATQLNGRPTGLTQGGSQMRSADGFSGGAALTRDGSRTLSARTLPAPPPDVVAPSAPNTEAFPEADDNPVKVTAETPVSTFSIDVDTASWSMVRNSLTRGTLPPEGAVRIEEMVNYFSYDYPAPEDGAPFATHVGVSDSPWREGTQIVHIGLQGALPGMPSSSEAVGQTLVRPAMNLVFLIDTSGSMNQPNKLPLLKQSFRLMLGQLEEGDSVSIVTYAGSAGRVLDPTPATDRATILAALDRLSAGGGTAGQEGLQQAYATAREMAQDGEVSRVILATDGDFNIGISDPDDLEDYIERERESGTYLSVLGFGRGNLDDATMQTLAQTGNGMAAYIDTLAEAQKVLVDQLTGALVPIADDVKIQVEWNPALVAEYRLIGYETRALNREDFNNDRVDAGEIGAGHQVTALYEITPVGSPARLTDPLRYGAAEVVSESDELGFLRLRHKAPGEDQSRLIETPILAGTAPLTEADWALAIAGFGQLLRGSDLIGDWSMGDAIALAQEARGEDRFGYRQEAITLMRLAQSLQQ